MSWSFLAVTALIILDSGLTRVATFLARPNLFYPQFCHNHLCHVLPQGFHSDNAGTNKFGMPLETVISVTLQTSQFQSANVQSSCCYQCLLLLFCVKRYVPWPSLTLPPFCMPFFPRIRPPRVCHCLSSASPQALLVPCWFLLPVLFQSQAESVNPYNG